MNKIVYSLKQNKSDYLYVFFYVVIFILLVFRITYTIVHYDEIFNLYVSWLTVAYGKQHLVENPYLFQTGNLFNLPFLWLYYHFFGETEGIVLFMRFVYLGFNIVLSVLFYYCLKEQLGKKNCILFSLILLLWSPLEMYTVYYDSAALFFMLAGELLLIKGKENNFLRIIAGVLHACMVYAYPLMILVFVANVIIIVCVEQKKVNAALRYIGGAAIVFSIFLLYVLAIGGVSKIIFFQPGFLEASLEGRVLGAIGNGMSESTSWRDNEVLYRIYRVIQETWRSERKLVYIFAIMLLQWMIGLKKRGKWRLLIIPEIIISGVWAFSQNQGGGMVWIRLFTWYYIWAPFLYFYISDEHKKVAKRFLVYLWVPSIFSYIAIGATALFESKAIMGFYVGAICSLIFMVILLIENRFGKYDLSRILILGVASLHLFLFCITGYEEEKMNQCTHFSTVGLWKGIHIPEEDAYFEEVYSFLNQHKELHSYYVSGMMDEYTAVLMTNSLTERIIELNHNSFPDILMIDKKTYDLINFEIKSRYDIVIQNQGQLLCVIKEELNQGEMQ